MCTLRAEAPSDKAVENPLLAGVACATAADHRAAGGVEYGLVCRTRVPNPTLLCALGRRCFLHILNLRILVRVAAKAVPKGTQQPTKVQGQQSR